VKIQHKALLGGLLKQRNKELEDKKEDLREGLQQRDLQDE
jgi:hypothetical protein